MVQAFVLTWVKQFYAEELVLSGAGKTSPGRIIFSLTKYCYLSSYFNGF